VSGKLLCLRSHHTRRSKDLQVFQKLGERVLEEKGVVLCGTRKI
jgi:hypothetical protein